jgi:hypothetical protein
VRVHPELGRVGDTRLPSPIDACVADASMSRAACLTGGVVRVADLRTGAWLDAAVTTPATRVSISADGEHVASIRPTGPGRQLFEVRGVDGQVGGSFYVGAVDEVLSPGPSLFVTRDASAGIDAWSGLGGGIRTSLTGALSNPVAMALCVAPPTSAFTQGRLVRCEPDGTLVVHSLRVEATVGSAGEAEGLSGDVRLEGTTTLRNRGSMPARAVLDDDRDLLHTLDPDGTIRTWHLPSRHCVSTVRCDEAAGARWFAAAGHDRCAVVSKEGRLGWISLAAAPRRTLAFEGGWNRWDARDDWLAASSARRDDGTATLTVGVPWGDDSSWSTCLPQPCVSLSLAPGREGMLLGVLEASGRLSVLEAGSGRRRGGADLNIEATASVELRLRAAHDDAAFIDERGRVVVVAWRDNGPARVMKGQPGSRATRLACDPEGRLLVAGYQDGTVVAWSGDAAAITLRAGQGSEPTALSVAGRGDEVVAADANGGLTAWRLARRPESLEVIAVGKVPSVAGLASMSHVPDGSRVACTSDSGVVTIVDPWPSPLLRGVTLPRMSLTTGAATPGTQIRFATWNGQHGLIHAGAGGIPQVWCWPDGEGEPRPTSRPVDAAVFMDATLSREAEALTRRLMGETDSIEAAMARMVTDEAELVVRGMTTTMLSGRRPTAAWQKTGLPEDRLLEAASEGKVGEAQLREARWLLGSWRGRPVDARRRERMLLAAGGTEALAGEPVEAASLLERLAGTPEMAAHRALRHAFLAVAKGRLRADLANAAAIAREESRFIADPVVRSRIERLLERAKTGR